MAISTIQFISQTKLGELSRQRSLLLEKYENLLNESRQHEGIKRLDVLRKGFGKITLVVGNPPLHRQLPNLQVLLAGAAPPPFLVDFWIQKLEAEITRGQKRADTVYLFGALLGEWGATDNSTIQWLNKKQAAKTLLLDAATTPVESPAPMEILQTQLHELVSDQAAVRRVIEDELQRSIDLNSSAYAQYGAIVENPHHPTAVRNEAKRFRDDAVLEQQFTDALRVATRDPRKWAWPEQGVATRALWTRNKWRLYPSLSFVDLAVLDSNSTFWSDAIGKSFSSQAQIINRKARIEHLNDLKAPDIICQNEYRMLSQAESAIDLGWYETIDPWELKPPVRAELPCQGIVAKRANVQLDLRDPRVAGYYGDDPVSPMVRLVHAEVRTLRAAFPDRPLYVAKLDIRDFFASISHDVLLTMLKGLGMTPEGLEFANCFLKVPLSAGDDVRTASRGVVMEQNFSHWLCEWLLRLMERYVLQNAQVRIVRQIDDICLLSPTEDAIQAGWKATREFLSDCGLETNDDKSGAVAIGAPVPVGLPDSSPRWGMLELTSSGDWQVHAATFENYLSDTRNVVAAKQAVLAKVMAYNSHLKFLSSSLGLAMDLGDVHRQTINDAMKRFDSQFFSEELGIAPGLLETIGMRFQVQDLELPESWMAWPITAGGLSLRLANVLSGQYQVAYDARKEQRKQPPTQRPENWQHGDKPWSEFYEDQLISLDPAKCHESSLMSSMVKSFIGRGQQISGGEQKELSDYWRWVLSAHGQVILDQFGTFEFLLTDLVPLQLIHEKLMQADLEDLE